MIIFSPTPYYLSLYGELIATHDQKPWFKTHNCQFKQQNITSNSIIKSGGNKPLFSETAVTHKVHKQNHCNIRIETKATDISEGNCDVGISVISNTGVAF